MAHIEIPFMGNDGLTVRHKKIFYDDSLEMNYPKAQKMKSHKILKSRNEKFNKNSKKNDKREQDLDSI